MRIVFLILFFTPLFCFSQERVSRQFAKISPVISSLAGAKGWTLNQDQRWVSRPNRIPVNFAGQNAMLIDYEKYKLGYDNFISYEFRRLIYGSDSMLMLMKKYRDGYYRYEHIEKGWTEFINCAYWTMATRDLQRFDLSKDSIGSYYVYCEQADKTGNLLGRNPIDVIRSDYKPNDERNKDLLQIQFQIIHSKNLVRFLISSSRGYWTLGYNTDLVEEKNGAAIDYHLDSCYFEVTLEEFKKFIQPINDFVR
jgi:hypothetical protein